MGERKGHYWRVLEAAVLKQKLFFQYWKSKIGFHQRQLRRDVRAASDVEACEVIVLPILAIWDTHHSSMLHSPIFENQGINSFKDISLTKQISIAGLS